MKQVSNSNQSRRSFERRMHFKEPLVVIDDNIITLLPLPLLTPPTSTTTIHTLPQEEDNQLSINKGNSTPHLASSFTNDRLHYYYWWVVYPWWLCVVVGHCQLLSPILHQFTISISSSYIMVPEQQYIITTSTTIHLVLESVPSITSDPIHSSTLPPPHYHYYTSLH